MLQRRRREVLLFFIHLLLFPAFALAAETPPWTPHWEFAGWEGGGCYPNVAFDPKNPGRVYLASDVAGIWRSDDRGENWRFITKGLGNLVVALVEVAPSDSNVLYAGTNAGVYVSLDAGNTWKAAESAGGKVTFSRPESHRSLLISKRDPGSLIVGSSQGSVYYSKDFGASWEFLGGRNPFGTKDPITVLAWLKDEEGLYAASSRGIAKFTFERNAKWRLLRGAPFSVTDFLVDAGSEKVMLAAGQKKLWQSRDGGKTWSAGKNIPAGHLYRLLVRPDGSLLAAWNENWKGGVIASEDGGATWKEHEKKMEADIQADPTRAWAGANGRITALKADPFDANVIFRTDFWGVWRSDDGGVTWKEKIKGAPNSVASDIAIDEDGAVYVATMDNGLLKSADGGATYRCLFPKNGYAADENGHVWRLLLSGKRVLATASPWETDLVQVTLSEDGGETFTKIRQGLPSRKPHKNTVWEHGYPRALAFHPSKPGTVYMGIDGDKGGGFFVSKDGGRSWMRPTSQPGSFKIYNALAVDPEDPDRLLWGASGATGGIYLSEDGGQNWKLSANPFKRTFDLAFGPGGRAYAAGEDGNGSPGLWFSEDHGKNWAFLQKFEGKGSPEALCVLPDGRLAFGIARWGGEKPGPLFITSADGKSFHSLDGDLPDGDGPAAMAYDPKSQYLYVARYAGSVYKTRLPEA